MGIRGDLDRLDRLEKKHRADRPRTKTRVQQMTDAELNALLAERLGVTVEEVGGYSIPELEAVYAAAHERNTQNQEEKEIEPCPRS